MSLPVTAPEHVAELLNQWYLQIEQNDLEKSGNTKKEIEGLLNGMEEDQTVLLYYSLLDYRYQCHLKDNEESNEGLDALISYYFYFYKGMHAYRIRDYDEAMDNYRQAEKRLEYVTDEIEKGEFYYKVASVYYQIFREELSLEFARKALAIFEKDPYYTKRTAHCRIAIALNLISLKAFSPAEDHLKMAWETATDEDDKELQYIICHNLGLLFKGKGDFEGAIEWLLESTKYFPADERTFYLLAESSCLLGQYDRAEKWIKEGMDYSQRVDHKSHWHRFRILKVRYGGYHPNLFEKVLSEAITFFYQEKIWKYVVENAPYLIDYLEKKGRTTDVNKYKDLVLKAEEKLTEDVKL